MSVDVVIPVGKSTRDQKYLQKLLAQLDNQTIPCNVIMVSDGNIGYARRRGVELGAAEIIAMIDSDVNLPSNDWIEKMLKPFEDPEVEIVHTLGTFHQDDPSIMRYALQAHPYKEGFSAGTGHTLMRRSAILKYGNFKDVNGCEDRLLIDQMKGKQVYMPDLKVYHYHATTLYEYLYKVWRVKVDCDSVSRKYPNRKVGKKYTWEYLKHNIYHFSRAIIGKDDPCFLWFPVVAVGMILTTRIGAKIWKR